MVPGKSEHASSIGMALASVLSTQLSMGSEDEGLRELCEHLMSHVQWEVPSEPMFCLTMGVLRLVARVPTPDGSFIDSEFMENSLDHLSTAHNLWLSRIILQTIWRWRCVRGPTGVLDVYGMASICEASTADDDQILDILKTNLFLALAMSLGLLVDFRDLYAPDNKYVTFLLFPLTQLIE